MLTQMLAMLTQMLALKLLLDVKAAYLTYFAKLIVNRDSPCLKVYAVHLVQEILLLSTGPYASLGVS